MRRPTAALLAAGRNVRALTGYEPNKGYKAIKLNWGAGLQAMMDGKPDLFVRPANPGAAMIEQLGMSKKFRPLDTDGRSPRRRPSSGLTPSCIPARSGTTRSRASRSRRSCCRRGVHSAVKHDSRVQGTSTTVRMTMTSQRICKSSRCLPSPCSELANVPLGKQEHW